MEMLQQQEGMSETTDPWEQVQANLGPSCYILGQEICLAFKVASHGIT